MNNKSNKENRTALDTQRRSADTAYNSYITPVRNAALSSLSNAAGERDRLTKLYGESNMPAGLVPNAQGWFNLPDTGGGGADFSAAKSGYSKLAETGGDFDEAEGLYRGMSYDPSGLRYRATSVIPSFYEGYKRDLQRRKNVQGGYSPGFDASMSEIAREKARQGYHASRDVEADIANLDLDVSKTRAAGIAGIAGQRSGNKLAALGGLTNIAGTEGSLAESRAGRNQSAQMSLLDAFMRDKAGRTAGLAELYRSAPGEATSFLDSWLRGIGGQTGNQLQNLGVRSQIQDRSFLDVLPGLLGAAGAGFTGIDAFRNRNRPVYNPEVYPTM